jgi:putative ABC transport system ATP-binding protein
MIQTENLTYQYKKGTAIFSFPNITLEKGVNLLILGASGIGKTTLLHLLAGLLKPVTGKIYINEVALNSLKNNKLDTFRGENIGLVFQKKHAIQSLNVFDNLKARLLFSNALVNDKKIGCALKIPKPKIAEANINTEKLGTIIFEGRYLSAIQPIEIAAIGLKY